MLTFWFRNNEEKLRKNQHKTLLNPERLKNFPSPTEGQFKAVPPTPRDGGTGLANLVPEIRTTELSNLFTVMEKVAYVAKVVPEIQTEFPAVPTEKDVHILEQRYDIIRRRLANYEDAERAQRDGEKARLIPFKLMLEELGVNEIILNNEKRLTRLLTKLIEEMDLNDIKRKPIDLKEPTDRIYRTPPLQPYEGYRKPDEILPIDLSEENILPKPFWKGPIEDLIRNRKYFEPNSQLADLLKRLLQVPKLKIDGGVDNNENPITSPPIPDDR